MQPCRRPGSDGGWPPAVPLQIHLMEDDEFALEGDLAAARELARVAEAAHVARVLEFLARFA